MRIKWIIQSHLHIQYYECQGSSLIKFYHKFKLGKRLTVKWNLIFISLFIEFLYWKLSAFVSWATQKFMATVSKITS